MFPIIWLLAAGAFLAGTSAVIDNELSTMFGPWPDADDFDTILGTDYLGYLAAIIWSALLRIGAAFAVLAAVTVWPSFELYGQTATPASHPWLVAVQAVPLVWLLVANWERIPYIGSGS